MISTKSIRDNEQTRKVCHGLEPYLMCHDLFVRRAQARGKCNDADSNTHYLQPPQADHSSVGDSSRFRHDTDSTSEQYNDESNLVVLGGSDGEDSSHSTTDMSSDSSSDETESKAKIFRSMKRSSFKTRERKRTVSPVVRNPNRPKPCTPT